MKTLLLIDANSLIHRSFHALPPFTNKEGKPTGALYGLASVLIKIDREERPDFAATCFDRPEPTFREEIFKEYKIHRPPTPDALASQLNESKNLFHKFGIKTIEAAGFEADDLIGALVEKFKIEPDLKITILTGDLDTLQLTGNAKVSVKVFKKGISETMIYDETAVKERYGIPPESLPDYKGLIGDSSDNIPGVPGIGPKTAALLLKKYKHLENILAKGKEEKMYEKVKNAEEQVFLSRQLGTIERSAPLGISKLNELVYSGIHEKELTPYFENLGFQSLIKRIRPATAPETNTKPTKSAPKKESGGQNMLF